MQAVQWLLRKQRQKCSFKWQQAVYDFQVFQELFWSLNQLQGSTTRMRQLEQWKPCLSQECVLGMETREAPKNMHTKIHTESVHGKGCLGHAGTP